MKRAQRPVGSENPSTSLSRRDIAALLDASRAAGEPIDLPSALVAILDAALGLLHADEGSIQLLDPSTQSLWIAASRGIPQEVTRNTRVPLGHGVSGRVAQSGKAALLSTPLEVERFAGLMAKERRIAAAICVPLRARGGVIGVMNLDVMDASRSFSPNDLELASLFADNAAHAIIGRQVLEHAERQTAEIETLRAASSSLAATLDLETLAENVLDRALSLAGTQRGMIVLGSLGGDTVTLARYRGFGRDDVRATLAHPGFQALLVQPPSAIVRDPGSALSNLGTEAFMALRVMPDDAKTPGLLVVALSPPLEGKVRLLRSFAPDAALALGNAALHDAISGREQELEAIVGTVPLPIVFVDADARFRSINPAAAELFRLSPEFEVGQPIDGKLGEAIEEMLLSGEEAFGREVVITEGGLPHVFRVAITAVDIDEDSGRVLVLDDVTAARELEQRKADFLAVIGHELRTPMTAIRGFTATLLRNDAAIDPATRKESLQRVLIQAERLERLIEDLLFISRIEQHRPPLHLAWDDAVAVTKSVVEEFRRRDLTRPILVDGSIGEMPVRMDRVKVEQILYHLLDNALKFSEPTTEVRVTLTQQEDTIEVAVRDKGAGIYSGDLPRLFRAFGQLDQSSTRRYGGTGVGLHVCKSLVDTFGGRIWADSVIGKGSTFTFTIPRNPPLGSDDDWVNQ